MRQYSCIRPRYPLMLQYLFSATDVHIWMTRNNATIMSLRGVKDWGLGFYRQDSDLSMMGDSNNDSVAFNLCPFMRFRISQVINHRCYNGRWNVRNHKKQKRSVVTWTHVRSLWRNSLLLRECMFWANKSKKNRCCMNAWSEDSEIQFSDQIARPHTCIAILLVGLTLSCTLEASVLQLKCHKFHGAVRQVKHLILSQKLNHILQW